MFPKLSDAGALAGCTVIDLSRVLGGPYCTQILADHGADVLKIEPPGGETRGWGPPFLGETASYFIGVNRNKRGMALDLSLPAELLRALLADADVLVENFKPGTLEKWGLGYETLSQAFPKLIHCRVSGFGADGPLGGLPGYDACAQAMCGLMSVNGEADGEATRVGLPVVDMVTGLNAAVAVLLALNERARSGLGQFLDITLYDCALSLLHPHAPNYFYSGKTPARSGNAHPNIAPYETLPTASGPIFLAVGNNRQFAQLATALGAPNWRETRATRPTPTGWPTASPCATPCRRCWRRTGRCAGGPAAARGRARRRRADRGPGPGPSAYPPSRHAAGTGRLPGVGSPIAVAHARQAAQAAAGAGRPGTRGRLADRAGDTA